MSDYSNGKIYQIRCNITGEIYIGSTTTSLSKRLSVHKSKSSCISKEIIEKGDYDISLLELYPCNNRIELIIKEREWYDKIDNINKNKPFSSIDERKDYIKDYNKKYYINNIDKYKEKITCECGIIICKKKKTNHFKSIKHQNYLSNIN
jgi:hypothetical protein